MANIADYDRIGGTDELALYEYQGEYKTAPTYLLKDGYGNEFPIDGDNERRAIVALLEE